MTGPEAAGNGRGRPHDSETAAADYLGGGLHPQAVRAFERHLLGCEQCWQEVEAGRTGRRLAESARQVAPLELREQLRAVIASEVGASEVGPASSVPVRPGPAGPRLAARSGRAGVGGASGGGDGWRRCALAA